MRSQLVALRRNLAELKNASAGDLRPIQLDQQAVGRLSRMDSLQMQAMDKARAARRTLSLKRIDAALNRLNEGEYGYCVACGDAIAIKRLDLDPATPHCAGCAK